MGIGRATLVGTGCQYRSASQLPSLPGLTSVLVIKAEDQGLEPRSVFSASRFQDGFLIQPDVFQVFQKRP